MTVSSRIGVMDSGNLIQVATPAEIYEAPINKDVADFIGDVNLLKGIYKGQNEIALNYFRTTQIRLSMLLKKLMQLSAISYGLL